MSLCPYVHVMDTDMDTDMDIMDIMDVWTWTGNMDKMAKSTKGIQ